MSRGIIGEINLNGSAEETLNHVLSHKGLMKNDVNYQDLLERVDKEGAEQVFNSLKPEITKFSNVVSRVLKHYYDQLVIRDISAFANSMNSDVIIKPTPENIEIRLNSILTLLNLPYEIYGGEQYCKIQRQSKIMQLGVDFSPSNNQGNIYDSGVFAVRFRHKIRNSIVEWSQLSVGERAVLSLISILFEQSDEIMIKPKLLLLDEPDAHLHPSAMSSLISVIREVIIGDMGINVILTTHSPVTLIASGVDLCLAMRNGETSFIGIDDAVESLMDGLSHLTVIDRSIIYTFTESKNDANIYQSLYSILSKSHTYNSYPQFLPSGSAGGGNCDLVRSIVESLPKSGMFKGIIDWDTKNDAEENVFVLAHSERYTIENCLFDPFVLSAFMIARNREFPIGIKDGDPSTLEFISNLEMAQSVSNKLSEYILGPDVGETFVQSRYEGGVEIQVYANYLLYNGHELENLLKDQIRSLRQCNNLKRDITIFLRDYPSMIPMAFVTLMQDLLGIKTI